MLKLLRSIVFGSLVVAGGCASEEPTPSVFRFVDALGEASIKDAVALPEDAPPLAEWRFEQKVHGWDAASGIRGLRAEDGRLSGRTTSAMPFLHIERAPGADEADILHAVEIRCRASAGTSLGVDFQRSEEPDLDALITRLEIGGELSMTTPIIPGDELRTYTMTVQSAPRLGAYVPSANLRHIFIRPTDVADAEFSIESVRLVFRKEHLATIPSGVSWQGFEDVFRETLVTRAPERLTFSVVLGERPWLELALGTVEDWPVSFHVEVEGRSVLEHTVTTPQRWEERVVDLDGLGRRRVEVRLWTDSPEEGALGFWGAPAIRNRGATPATARSSPLGNAPPRGVILFIGDTLRRDHLDVYDYDRETAPHLARMAAEGVLFADSVSQASWTKVSVSSILSSLYPTTHGVATQDHRISSVATTIAEVYREAGYATLSLASNGFVGQRTNLHQGFEVVYEPESLRAPRNNKTARPAMDRLLPWLEAHHEGPFFAFVHVLDPHSPFEPNPPYDAMWTEPGGKAIFEALVDQVRPHIEAPSMRNRGHPTAEEMARAGVEPDDFLPHELGWYDGAVRGMDAEIGRLFERLRQLGIEDQTLVVFLSDHGEEFLDHGRHWHGNSVYAEMIDVPLIMRWPGVLPAGVVVADTVESIDVMPTLIELSGLTVPERAQGDPLTALIAAAGSLSTGLRWSPRPVFSERVATGSTPGTRQIDSLTIIADGWKLIRNVRRPEGYPEFELYRRDEDPADRNDVAAEHPDVVERLASQLEDWHQFAAAERLPEGEAATEGMSPAELERLRSLGYIQ